MYLDSCIIVKLLTRESDSDFFDEALRGKRLVSSELAYSEVASALMAKERAGNLSAPDRRKAWQQFLAWIDSDEVRLQDLNHFVVHKAAHQLERCHPSVPLRTLDALHLAACDLTQNFPLCTTDERLREAAKVLKIPVFPES